MFRGIAPTERGGYSLREMAQQHGPFQYFNSLLGTTGAPSNKHGSAVLKGTSDSYAIKTQSGSRRTGLLSGKATLNRYPRSMTRWP